jgi:iron complex transport system ATP-binding protein
LSLAARDLGVRYGSRVGLQPCRLELERGQVVALIGPNGAGKTSLLRALAGLVAAAGSIHWCGTDLATLDRRARARTLAYLEQAPQAHWPISVRELVSLGRLPHRRFGRSMTVADGAAVDEALLATGIGELANRSVMQLSGGEAMRAQLARALAVQAPVLLADEPVASLDPYHQLRIMETLAKHARNDGLVVVVMHDLTLAARHATRMLLLHEGHIVADGSPAEVLTPEAIARYYRVDAYTAQHDGEIIALPWRHID